MTGKSNSIVDGRSYSNFTDLPLEHETVGDVSAMRFAEFCEIYDLDMGPRLKESTWAFKKAIIDTKLLPYFGKMVIGKIDTQDIFRWQNRMMSFKNKRGEPYSTDYLRDIHAQLSAIFNHAVRYYGLLRNPASIVGTFERGAPHEMDYWTKEEYSRFAESIKDNGQVYYAFEMLYWTGMREGELLALTPADIDLDRHTVTINKTYHRIHGKDVVTSPKTRKSNRTISLPEFLCDEIEDYINEMAGSEDSDDIKSERLFPLSGYQLRATLAA